MFRILCSFLIIICSCSAKQGSFAGGSDNRADTLWERNKVTIKRAIESKSAPSLLETTTVIINDSMFQSNAYRVLRSIKLTDSLLNFMNHISEEDIKVKHFEVKRDTLLCDVYFHTIDGRFYVGEVAYDSAGTLILKQGKYIEPEGYGGRPVSSKLSYKVYVPANFKVKEVLFRW
jgi:hypothetical protein